jgi:phosphoglycolate phosphatase-like HAD superfamily hydrolase
MIQDIILDFDGVILESVDVKTNAFRQLFSFTPEHVDEIVRYHVENGGMSRFDKFRHIYSSILKEPLSDAKFSELSVKFSELVYSTILITPFVAGSREFITGNHGTTALHIVTATPETEIRQILKARNLDPYFKSVHGAPTTKVAAIEEILKKAGVPPSSAVFIGDSKNDWSAAEATGVRFIGRIRPSDDNPFFGLPGVTATIPDLNSLKDILETFS